MSKQRILQLIDELRHDILFHDRPIPGYVRKYTQNEYDIIDSVLRLASSKLNDFIKDESEDKKDFSEYFDVHVHGHWSSWDN